MKFFSESEVKYLKENIAKWLGDKKYNHIAERMIYLLRKDEESKMQLFLEAYSKLRRSEK